MPFTTTKINHALVEGTDGTYTVRACCVDGHWIVSDFDQVIAVGLKPRSAIGKALIYLKQHAGWIHTPNWTLEEGKHYVVTTLPYDWRRVRDHTLVYRGRHGYGWLRFETQTGDEVVMDSTDIVRTTEVPVDGGCLRCGQPITYRATLGAPGVGQSWECPNGHTMIKIGTLLIDPLNLPEGEEPSWIMTPEETV